MRVKLFRKRLKKTKKGKIIRRSSHLGHTKAKDATKIKRRRLRPILVKKQKKSILKHS
ncbi:MAG: hypothetical protein PHH35_01100 [Candidatus Pacebacteria bacterium]|jgi:ribosomal protein L35|nr:hypothetical protein [Candidatus Paceibacterota bacterium]